jgi:phospholipid/cholesterol/gamma-HCH transport system substrate-binding protein
VSNYESIQKKQNLIVGVFAVAGILALVLMIYKFGDLPTSVGKIGSFPVYVQFPAATGVQQDTPVRFCGYQIGRVTNILPPKVRKDLNTGLNYHQTVVVLSIDNKYVDIPSNVDVKLMTRGLGSSYIELVVDPLALLVAKDPNRPETKFLVARLMLQGSTGMTSEFFPAESQKKLDEIVTGLSTFINNANDILGDQKNKDNIKSSLENVAKATEQATKSLKKFEEFSAAGASALVNMDEKIDKVVATMVNTSDELGKMVAQLRMVMEKINNGKGTAGQLINDGRLYENLLETSLQLDTLVQQFNTFITESRNKGLPLKLK